MIKLKYVVKLLPIYGQSQIYGQILYAICPHSNTLSNESYGHFPHIIWSTMQQIYGQNLRKSPYIIVTDMTYVLVNWTDVTSTEAAFAKISGRAHKRSFTRYVVSFTDPPPLGRSLGIWPSRSRYAS